MTERKKSNLPLNELTAVSILDGRNRKDIQELASYVSEFNIICMRVGIEAKYLINLSKVGVVRRLTPKEQDLLSSLSNKLTLYDAQNIKKIEEETNHDVKAMERGLRMKLEGSSLKDVIEMVHIGLTSEDVNNLTYRLILRNVTEKVLIPTLDVLIDELVQMADKSKDKPMLARTHGQPAVPTTIGKELVNFAVRLNKQTRELESRQLEGKMTGAVGNLNALRMAYPEIDWMSFSQKFVRSFGFEPNLITTQLNPYEDMIAYFQNYQRINNIIVDLDQDMWRYISDGWFIQEIQKGEVGSSTMPQKVNPIRFENSEGNLGKANALFEYFSRKLGVSRLQRDLSDSTVIRDMGVPLGYSFLSYKNTLAQLQKISPDDLEIAQAFYKDWSIMAEAAQVLMRKYKVKDPYSMMAEFTRGKDFGEEEWGSLVDNLPLDEKVKRELEDLSPENYIGYAIELTEKAISEIRSSRSKK